MNLQDLPVLTNWILSEHSVVFRVEPRSIAAVAEILTGPQKNEKLSFRNGDLFRQALSPPWPWLTSKA